ncbi:MAG: DUF3021 domain-containing protein [Methanobrevibacter sp.]|jgi:hypothetical protein|nr:DUF3021 domain-containing protein [Methanobrevibacter sp.]
MDNMKIARLIFLGASIGCFVISLVELLMISIVGFSNFSLNGYEIFNFIIGGIVVGIVFALGSLIYEREDLSLLTQTAIQMGSGFIVLFIVGIYLQWIPINEGIAAIITWIIISLIFGFVFWGGFYIRSRFEAKRINQKLKNRNNN